MPEAPKTGESYLDFIKKLNAAQEGDTVKVGTGGSEFIGEVTTTLTGGMTVATFFPDQLKGHVIEMRWKGGGLPQGGIAYQVLKQNASGGYDVVQPERPSKALQEVSVIPGKREKPLFDM